MYSLSYKTCLTWYNMNKMKDEKRFASLKISKNQTLNNSLKNQQGLKTDMIVIELYSIVYQLSRSKPALTFFSLQSLYYKIFIKKFILNVKPKF